MLSVIDGISLPNGAPALRSSAAISIRLIGTMAAWTATGESVMPVGRKTRALLAILATTAPRPFSRSRLAELLWSRRPDEQARASLRQEIHRLLDALQPAGRDIVRVARDHLSLRADLAWIDVDEVQRATPAEPSSLALFDGELLGELSGVDPALDRWLATERERLRNRARTVAESLLREQGTPEAVVPAAQQLLAIDRAHEGAWRALMGAFAERGERNLAIEAYDQCKAALTDLLQAAPSPETQSLAARIRTGSVTPANPDLARVTSARPDRRGAAKVGVLPLQLIGTGADEAHLSTGLAEEVTAALARFRQLFLVSSSSLAQYGERNETALRRSLGLDFLLDGSIQRDARQLRVTMRLLDLREGNQVVWARHFDRQTDDLLTLQDEIAAEVVAQIDPQILSAEARHATHLPPEEDSAYNLVVRAVPLITRLQRDEFARAGDMLARAIALDPGYAAAHAWRASWATFCVGQGWDGDQDIASQAAHHAERAIILDPQDAWSLTIAGHVRAFLHRRPREAMELHARALSMNPNLAVAWGISAATFTFVGAFDEAARRYARYARLNPIDPQSFLFDAGMALLALGRRDYAAAIRLARRCCDVNPHYASGLKHYLSALGHAGLPTEAASVTAKLLAIEPGFTVQAAIRRSPLEHAAEVEHYAHGLRQAGLPEGSPVAVHLPGEAA